MGACYLVNVKARIKDKQKFVEDSKKVILGDGSHWRNDLKDEIKNMKTVNDVMRFMLAAHQNMARYSTDQDGFTMYTSAFDASYSWESVLDEWFLGIGSDLADGSYILVNGDAETWKDSVVNGKAITVKRNRTRFENFFNDEYCASFGKKKLTILVNKL